jgi:hypothetical protein
VTELGPPPFTDNVLINTLKLVTLAWVNLINQPETEGRLMYLNIRITKSWILLPR